MLILLAEREIFTSHMHTEMTANLSVDRKRAATPRPARGSGLGALLQCNSDEHETLTAINSR
jgi:hypothetical protein